MPVNANSIVLPVMHCILVFARLFIGRFGLGEGWLNEGGVENPFAEVCLYIDVLIVKCTLVRLLPKEFHAALHVYIALIWELTPTATRGES